jgi:predicted amidophosphoribosyltransferase
VIATLLSQFTDLVLPRRCVGCGRSETVWCTACRPGAEPVRVPKIRPSAFASGAYEGPLRTAILAYKERGRRELAGALGSLLAPAVAASLDAAGLDTAALDRLPHGPDLIPDGAVLIPVPSSARARRERGGDHVLRLARRAGRVTGCAVAPVLRLGRPVQDSAGLGAAERQRNLYGAMRAIPPPTPTPSRRSRPALLVDDIVTTGASLAEAARALTEAGWEVAGAAVIAATPRRHTDERW